MVSKEYFQYLFYLGLDEAKELTLPSLGAFRTGGQFMLCNRGVLQPGVTQEQIKIMQEYLDGLVYSVAVDKAANISKLGKPVYDKIGFKTIGSFDIYKPV